MTRSRALSRQTLAVLSALVAAPADWQHGYDIARQAGLMSGTLYPILMRLEAQGYLQAQWQQAAVAGRPPRHAYRLTAAGMQLVAEQIKNHVLLARPAAS
jgi:PadR family transcriptional regulator, regulatory protein PadR